MHSRLTAPAAMALRLTRRRTSLAMLALILALAAGAMAANASEPIQPRLAYLTQTATGTPKVWIASANGGESKLLGPGTQPLIAPDGQLVAVSLSGVSPGIEEKGPALGIYPASGALIADFLSLEAGIATPL